MNAITTGLSGLMASTAQLTASASNVANAHTSVPLAGADWGPATNVTIGGQATTPAYDPQSPYANEDGLVAMPNVDIAREAVNQMVARQSFQANLNTIRIADEMQRSLLAIV